MNEFRCISLKAIDYDYRANIEVPPDTTDEDIDVIRKVFHSYEAYPDVCEIQRCTKSGWYFGRHYEEGEYMPGKYPVLLSMIDGFVAEEVEPGSVPVHFIARRPQDVDVTTLDEWNFSNGWAFEIGPDCGEHATPWDCAK